MSTSDPILAALKGLESTLCDRLSTEMGRQLAAVRLDMNGRFDAIEARLDRLAGEYQMILAGLRRIEEHWRRSEAIARG